MGTRASLWARKALFTHSLASKSVSENFEKSIFQHHFSYMRIIRFYGKRTRPMWIRSKFIAMAFTPDSLAFVAPGDVITKDAGFMRSVTTMTCSTEANK